MNVCSRHGTRRIAILLEGRVGQKCPTVCNMNIDEAIEKLTARLNCRQAMNANTCGQNCSECILFSLQGNFDESIELDRYSLAALLTIKKWKKSGD